jgi:hypothetical protein
MSGVQRQIDLNKVEKVLNETAYKTGICFEVNDNLESPALLIICPVDKTNPPLVLVISSDFKCIKTLYWYDASKCSPCISKHVPTNDTEWRNHVHKNGMSSRSKEGVTFKHYRYIHNGRRQIRFEIFPDDDAAAETADQRASRLYRLLEKQREEEEAEMEEVIEEEPDSMGNTHSHDGDEDSSPSLRATGRKVVEETTSDDDADWSYAEGATYPVIRQRGSIVDDGSIIHPSYVFTAEDLAYYDSRGMPPFAVPAPLTPEQEQERTENQAAKLALKTMRARALAGETLTSGEQATLDQRQQKADAEAAKMRNLNVVGCRNKFASLSDDDDEEEEGKNIVLGCL